jgi:hypothetical protein
LAEWTVVVAILALAALVGLGLVSGGVGKVIGGVASGIDSVVAGVVGGGGPGPTVAPSLTPGPPCVFDDTFGRTTSTNSGWGSGPCGLAYAASYPNPANSDASVTPGDAYWKVWNQDGGGTANRIPFPASFPSPVYHYAYQLTGTYTNSFGSATSLCFPAVCLDLNSGAPGQDTIGITGSASAVTPIDYDTSFSLRVEVDPGNSIAVWLWQTGSMPASPTYVVAYPALISTADLTIFSYGDADYGILNLSDLRMASLDGGPAGPTP